MATRYAAQTRRLTHRPMNADEFLPALMCDREIWAKVKAAYVAGGLDQALHEAQELLMHAIIRNPQALRGHIREFRQEVTDAIGQRLSEMLVI